MKQGRKKSGGRYFNSRKKKKYEQKLTRIMQLMEHTM
jgi:hypothetical protein